MLVPGEELRILFYFEQGGIVYISVPCLIGINTLTELKVEFLAQRHLL